MMPVKKLFSPIMIVMALNLACVAPASALDEINGEVLTMEGAAYLTNESGIRKGLRERDLIREGDAIEVMPGARVLIGFDKEWKNVTLLDEDSKVFVASIYPMSFKLADGQVFTNLEAMPSGCAFEVRTPLLVARASGGQWQTTFLDEESQVFSFSDTPVSVYGRDTWGNLSKTPLVLARSRSTSLTYRGGDLEAANPVTSLMNQRWLKTKEWMQQKAKSTLEAGRRANLRQIDQIRDVWKVNLRHTPAENAEFHEVDVITPKSEGQLNRPPPRSKPVRLSQQAGQESE